MVSKKEICVKWTDFLDVCVTRVLTQRLLKILMSLFLIISNAIVSITVIPMYLLFSHSPALECLSNSVFFFLLFFFPLFIKSIANVSIPNSIPLSWLKILIGYKMDCNIFSFQPKIIIPIQRINLFFWFSPFVTSFTIFWVWFWSIIAKKIIVAIMNFPGKFFLVF